MLRRKERTVDIYLKAGAAMRLYRTMGSRLILDISKILSAPDQDMLLRLMLKIDRICSKAEDNMFYDHPRLPDSYMDVFYGSTDVEPGSDVDIKIIEIARKVASTLVWDKKTEGEAQN